MYFELVHVKCELASLPNLLWCLSWLSSTAQPNIDYRQILASFSKRTAELIPTTVLIVYPAVDSVFQRAVLTLADFLQSSGVCSVAIDEWQRGCLAKLGTLRWLHTVSESSDRVLIVLPGHATGLGTSVF